MLRSLRILTSAVALAALVPIAAQAQDKPVTPKQVAKNIQSETHRVGRRLRDETHKVGHQTNKQTQRAGKSAARVVSRDARKGDYRKFDVVPPKGPQSSNASPRAYEATAAARERNAMKADKPVTPKEVGLTASGDVKRAAKQTEDQVHRTGKSLKKIVSRKARKGQS
jgi:hypothetical protein